MMTNFKKTISTVVVGSSIVTGGVITGDSIINPYTSTETTFEIAEQSMTEGAGENKVVISKASPEVTFKKWDSESDFSVKYTDVQGQGSRPIFSNRIEWGSGEKEVHAYPIETSASVGEDGGFEIEIVLNQIPASNVFSFEINGAEEYDFFYQPALTEQEIQEGNIRPENVVGSYAVYHKEKKDYILGQKNYGSGKAYHIYRPKAVDANGTETWGELNIENGILTVTIPQKYLDAAIYPVKVDPTFGYTSIGASATTTNSSVFRGIITSSPSNGFITKITVYQNQATTGSAKAFIVDSGGNFITNGSANTASVSGPGWIDATMSNPTINIGTYWIGVIGGGFFQTKYDTVTNEGKYDSTNNYTTPTAPTDAITNSEKVSIYATYTATRRIIIGQ